MPETLIRTLQPAGEPVIVDDWKRDEDFPVFPMGSKPKRLLVCPEHQAPPFLIPNHSYLFKTGSGWRAHQVWSEVLAYRIGRLAGLSVPPCFLAVERSSGEVGALVEFFYGYPHEAQKPRLVHALDLLSPFMTDKKRGRPHVMGVNVGLCRRLVGPDTAMIWWARALAFDALIGNTDRHPENWGFLVRLRQDRRPVWEMAPLFDNGTSLGYEVPENRLARASEPARLSAYVGKGTHDCGWTSPRHDGPMAHFELCRRYLAAYENAGVHMLDVIRFQIEQITAITQEFIQFDVANPFTEERARFVTALIRARKTELEALLAG